MMIDEKEAKVIARVICPIFNKFVNKYDAKKGAIRVGHELTCEADDRSAIRQIFSGHGS